MKVRTALFCAVVSIALAGDMPYVGKWKMNLAKSDFGQTTIMLESLPGGEWQFTGFGITYKFKMDGKEVADGMGGTTAWKQVDANTWSVEAKANGKVTETDTFKLSADGKKLSQSSKSMKVDGGSIDNTTVYERASGGPSLEGKWKTKNISGGSSMFEYVASGTDGLIYKDPDMGLTCDAKLDGKDYPCTGPMTPPGFTVSLKRGTASLEFSIKKDGKPIFNGSYTVSADGKSMVETGTLPSSGEKFKIAYDRM